MNKALKILTEIVLLAAIVFLVYVIYGSIMQPVNFNKEKAQREAVAIQRLKDIRTLQVAFKAANNRFTSSVDSLKLFYESGSMSIMMQVGSKDDSLADAHTKQVRKRLRGKDVNAQLYQLYLAGDQNLVFTIETKIPIRDTLFVSREDFCVDSLKYIPFSGGELIEMDSDERMVSGVKVPLFEARIPYKKLLKGMDNQLRINLDAERISQNKYEGLQVGSISAPNNNAGNWE